MVQADLTEVAGGFFVICGLLVLEKAPKRWLLAAAVFGLGGLARETSLVFPMAILGVYFLRGRRDDIRALYLLLSFVPLVAWKVFLKFWLGGWGGGPGIEVPLKAVFILVGRDPLVLASTVFLLVGPALLMSYMFFFKMGGERMEAGRLFLWFNVALNVVFINTDAFVLLRGGERLSIMVVLSAIMLLHQVNWMSFLCRQSAIWAFVLWFSTSPAFIMASFN